ncbi:MAG: TIGR02147 family protein [Alphaproteobacteria bacterium]|nr:TIGR02147 family protein [Alphaproteobacteria bacterium]
MPASSPSLLHLVIRGERNITENTLPGFCRAIGLRAEARSHFALLVELDRAETHQERDAVFERIRHAGHFRAANALEAAAFDYLADWTLPAVRELAGAPGFRHAPSWVARHLRPQVTPTVARDTLEKLVQLGMLVPTDDGGATQQDVSIVTPHEVAGLAVFRYHHGMLARASEALETVDAADRHYGAVTVRVPTALIPSLKAEVAAFQERVLALCDSAPADGGPQRVVQLNLQLFPLSEDVP